MSILERAQRRLALDYANSPKVAVLFFIHAAGWYALDLVGVHDLANPWLALTLIPNTLIYIAERFGKLQWFRGMTLPSLLVMTASLALDCVLNSEMYVPAFLAYFILAGLLAAFGFLGYRVWTFDPNAEGNRQPG